MAKARVQYLPENVRNLLAQISGAWVTECAVSFSADAVRLTRLADASDTPRAPPASATHAIAVWNRFRMPPLRRILLAVVLLVVAGATLFCDSLVHLALQRFMQHSLTALGAGVVSIGAVRARPWSLELGNLIIYNAAGNWSTPHALEIERMHVSVGSLAGLLSLHPGGLLRLGCLEFTTGFRIKALEHIEYEGVAVYLEDAATVTSGAEVVVQRGQLRKEPLNGRLGSRKLRDFVLEPTLLSWYEPGEHAADPRFSARPKGKLRLFPSTVVELSSEDKQSFTLVSSADALTMVAADAEEREAWCAALQRAIASLASGATRPSHSNAPWFEALVAEDEARKVVWRRHAQRRRKAWRQRWQEAGIASSSSGGEGESAGMGDEASSRVDRASESSADTSQPHPTQPHNRQQVEEEAGREEERAKERKRVREGQGGAWWDPAHWLEGMSHGARWAEEKVAAHEVKGQSLEEMIEWQIGVTTFSGNERAPRWRATLLCACLA